MIQIAKSPFAPRNLPDNRVAHYCLPRREFVIVTKVESDRLLKNTFRVVFAVFFMCMPCLVLWIMFSKSVIGFELPIMATAAVIIIAAIIDHRFLAPSKALLMRAPLSTEKAPLFSISILLKTGMATLDDRMLGMTIRNIIVLMALAAAYLAMGYFGHSHRPVKPHMIVTSAIMLPLLLALLILFYRERLRRKSLAKDNPNP